MYLGLHKINLTFVHLIQKMCLRTFRTLAVACLGVISNIFVITWGRLRHRFFIHPFENGYQFIADMICYKGTRSRTINRYQLIANRICYTGTGSSTINRYQLIANRIRYIGTGSRIILQTNFFVSIVAFLNPSRYR